MAEERYDVLIVGAGPAGSTAAILLAMKDRRVALIEREHFPRPAPGARWLSRHSAELLKELEAPTKDILATPFEAVTFYRADFSASAAPVFEKTPGYLIDRSEFDQMLVSVAVKRGVTFLEGCPVIDVDLQEQFIIARLEDERAVEARMLIVASGRNTPLRERAGLERERGAAPIWTAQVEAALGPEVQMGEPRVGVVLGLDGGGSFGLCCVGPRRATVGVHWRGEPGEVHSQLMKLCRDAWEHKIVPVDLTRPAGAAEIIGSPALAALDMESHVGKHTLVVGDAGGFLSAASNEGIYPAMWSAKIAAEVMDRALQNPSTQDELMVFDSAWRMEMADFLRAPHTDIQFLLPLVFSNQPMTDRMGAAFFFGENI